MPWTPELEQKCREIIERIAKAPRGQHEQKQRGAELFNLVLPALNSIPSKQLLGKDGMDTVVSNVWVRLSRNQYSNVLAFRRWVRARQQETASEPRSFERWLRKLCRWETLRLLRERRMDEVQEYTGSVSLAVANRASSTTLPPERIDRQKRQELLTAVRKQALAELDPEQVVALNIYIDVTTKPLLRGQKRKAIHKAYAQIQRKLKLESEKHADNFHRVAKQRFKRAMKRLLEERGHLPAPPKAANG